MFLIASPLRFSVYKRRKRFCPYCLKYVINIYYHRFKHHPDKPASDFHYDTKAKLMGVGPYEDYKGYFCPKCNTVRNDLDKHYANKHNDVDQTTKGYENMKKASAIRFSEWSAVVQRFKNDLVTDGGGTGIPCSESDAQKYHNQILKLIPDQETFLNFKDVYSNMENTVDKSKDGFVSTQHAYSVTLLRFLRSLLIHNYRFTTKQYLKSFIERAKQWQKGLRKKRIKREEEYNLKESAELESEVSPFTAILRYEQTSLHKQICSYRNDDLACSDVKKVRLVYADIFTRIIYRQGNRGSTIRGMTVGELHNVHKSSKGQLAITVNDQKDVHLAFIAVEANELEDLRKASELGWRFFNICEPNRKAVAFPAVSEKANTGEKMTSNYLSHLLQLVSTTIYPITHMTTTRVRKMIETQVADENLELREKVAQASGHSVFIARKHYDMRDKKDNVHAARDHLKSLAEKGKWKTIVIFCRKKFVVACSRSVN